MNNQIIPQNPIVIHEKARENQSRDVAAIIAANSKGNSNSILSSVWLKRRENHFRVDPRHIWISGIATGVSLGIISAIVGIRLDYAFSITLAAIVISSISFLFIVYRNADTLEYEVIYESNEKHNEQVVDSKVTYRIETQKENRTTMMDLPSFFQAVHVAALATMHRNGERFNVRNVTRAHVCTQQQFPELRDKLAHSNMLIKSGKTWTLTDEFMMFARQAVPAPQNNLI